MAAEGRGRVKKYIYPALIGILTAGSAFVLYDMQVAEGMGLYFAMQAGTGNRVIFDIIVEIVGMAALLAVTSLPFLLYSGKNQTLKKPEHFFRILVSYLAFMPGISMSYLLHLFVTPKQNAEISAEVIFGNVESVFFNIKTLILFVILAGGVYCVMEQQKLAGVHYIILTGSVVCMVLAIVLSNYTQLFGYLAAYALIILLIAFWNRINLVNWPIYGLLFIQSIYNMYCVLAKYHL